MSAVNVNTVTMNTLTLNTQRATRPVGLDGAIYRLGLTLVAWSRSRSSRRIPTPESNEAARELQRMLRERERDALSSALLLRNS